MLSSLKMCRFLIINFAESSLYCVFGGKKYTGWKKIHHRRLCGCGLIWGMNLCRGWNSTIIKIVRLYLILFGFYLLLRPQKFTKFHRQISNFKIRKCLFRTDSEQDSAKSLKWISNPAMQYKKKEFLFDLYWLFFSPRWLISHPALWNDRYLPRETIGIFWLPWIWSQSERKRWTDYQVWPACHWLPASCWWKQFVGRRASCCAWRRLLCHQAAQPALPSWRRPVSTPKTFGCSASPSPSHQPHQLGPAASKTGLCLGGSTALWDEDGLSPTADFCRETCHWQHCSAKETISPPPCIACTTGYISIHSFVFDLL